MIWKSGRCMDEILVFGTNFKTRVSYNSKKMSFSVINQNFMKENEIIQQLSADPKKVESTCDSEIA